MACGIYIIYACVSLLIAAIVWAHLNLIHNDSLGLAQRYNSLGERTVFQFCV